MCLAVPVQIIAIFEDRTALVSLNNVERKVSLVLTPEAREGDYVLVHTGYALSVLDPLEAEQTLALLDEMAAHADMEDELDHEIH